MEPSEVYKKKYHSGSPWFEGELSKTVHSLFQPLHDLKMRSDESEISDTCQKLINLLFAKYPNLVAKPE